MLNRFVKRDLHFSLTLAWLQNYTPKALPPSAYGTLAMFGCERKADIDR